MNTFRNTIAGALLLLCFAAVAVAILSVTCMLKALADGRTHDLGTAAVWSLGSAVAILTLGTLGRKVMV